MTLHKTNRILALARFPCRLRAAQQRLAGFDGGGGPRNQRRGAGRTFGNVCANHRELAMESAPERVGVEPKLSIPKSLRMMALRLPPNSNWSRLVRLGTGKAFYDYFASHETLRSRESQFYGSLGVALTTERI